MFDADGTLLRCETLRFDTGADLRAAAIELLEMWPMECTQATGCAGDGVGLAQARATAEPEPRASDSARITHIVVEGDSHLRREWEEAAAEVARRASGKAALASTESEQEEGARLLCVSPAVWRQYLLTHRENQSGERAKEAARLIARQLVDEIGSEHVRTGRPLSTDAAEAVMIGYYALLTLKWIIRDPPVRRWSNGKVVVPGSPQAVHRRTRKISQKLYKTKASPVGQEVASKT